MSFNQIDLPYSVSWSPEKRHPPDACSPKPYTSPPPPPHAKPSLAGNGKNNNFRERWPLEVFRGRSGGVEGGYVATVKEITNESRRDREMYLVGGGGVHLK